MGLKASYRSKVVPSSASDVVWSVLMLCDISLMLVSFRVGSGVCVHIHVVLVGFVWVGFRGCRLDCCCLLEAC